MNYEINSATGNYKPSFSNQYAAASRDLRGSVAGTAYAERSVTAHSRPLDRDVYESAQPAISPIANISFATPEYNQQRNRQPAHGYSGNSHSEDSLPSPQLSARLVDTSTTLSFGAGSNLGNIIDIAA